MALIRAISGSSGGGGGSAVSGVYPETSGAYPSAGEVFTIATGVSGLKRFYAYGNSGTHQIQIIDYDEDKPLTTLSNATAFSLICYNGTTVVSTYYTPNGSNSNANCFCIQKIESNGDVTIKAPTVAPAWYREINFNWFAE